MEKSLLREVNDERETGAGRAPLQFDLKPYVISNATVYFNGQCDQCRPQCAAICCRAYGFVTLTEEEARSGRYNYKEVSGECDCDNCKKMRELGVKYTVRKNPDGSCIYLDGSRKCSIYKDRPEVCKSYSCVNVPFALALS
jgi:hypothetical protein